MNYPNYDPTAQATARDMAQISGWIDAYPANAGRTELEQLLLRTVVKLREEEGESAGAVIGMLDQNPRKGITHTRDDLLKEMLDRAATALLGVEHITGNQGRALPLLFAHIARVHERMRASQAQEVRDALLIDPGPASYADDGGLNEASGSGTGAFD